MNLHNFSSFFEILAALNIGYAGSDIFREGISDYILKLKYHVEKIDTEIKKVNRDIRFASIERSQDAVKKINVISDLFHKYADTIVNKKKDFPKFTEAFKSMFLVSGLYCLFVLLMEGYNQYYELKDHCLIPICLFWTNWIILMNIFIFGRSMVWGKYEKPLHYGWVILSFIVIILTSVFFYKIDAANLSTHAEIVEGRNNITFSVMTGISPFILHLLRSFLHEKIYAFRFYILRRVTRIKIGEITENLDKWANPEKDLFEDKQNLKKVIWQVIVKFLIRIYKKIDPFFKDVSFYNL